MDIIALILQAIGIVFLFGILIMLLGLVAFTTLIIIEELTERAKKKGGKKK